MPGSALRSRGSSLSAAVVRLRSVPSVAAALFSKCGPAGPLSLRGSPLLALSPPIRLIVSKSTSVPVPPPQGAPQRKPLSLRQSLWDQRHAWGNMAMLFSCGMLSFKVAQQRRELEDAEAAWAASERQLAAHVEATSAELDALRSAVQQELQAGTKDLTARISTIVEASERRAKKESQSFLASKANSLERSEPSRLSPFTGPTKGSSGASPSASKYMV